MDAAQFRTSSSGRVVRTVHGAHAFVPNPLPPRLTLEPLVGAIATASQKLGELAGIGHGLVNPLLVVAPFQRHEAVASSRIEGTVATLTDVMAAEAGGRADRRPPDTREVQNYVKALEYAVARLPKLPLSLRLIREIHTLLLGGDDPQGRAAFPPGEFRRVQNWIGGVTPASARFVPPPAPEMARALDAFERYLHASPRLPVVVDAALMHYQFEAIHPFPDGNGRVGRILIPLFLMMRGALPTPLLYLSPFFERNREAYYDRLFEVSRRGDWAGWIDFFAKGVSEQAADTVRRLQRLADLRARYGADALAAQAGASVLRLIDHLFVTPYLSMPSIRGRFGITHRAAQQQINRLVERGILSSVPGEVRPRLYVARQILDLLQEQHASQDVSPSRRATAPRRRRS